jgi:DNA-binding protein Fis
VLKVFLDPKLYPFFKSHYVRYNNKIYFSDPERPDTREEAWEIAILSEKYFSEAIDITALEKNFPFCTLFFLPHTIVSPNLQHDKIYIYDDDSILAHNAPILFEALLQISELRETNHRNQYLLNPFTQGPTYKEFMDTLQSVSWSPLPILLLGEKGIQKYPIVQFLFPGFKIETIDFMNFENSGLLFFLTGDEFSGGFLKNVHQCVFFDNIQYLSQENQLFLYTLATNHGYDYQDKHIVCHYPIIFGGDENIGELRRVKELYQTVAIPPIRDRKEDLPFLITMILNEIAIKYKTEVPPVSVELLMLCQEYPWPENETQVIRFCEIYLFEGIEKATEYLMNELRSVDSPSKLPNLNSLLEAMNEWVENTLIKKAMAFSGGNRKKAAPMLGITYKSLCKKLTTLDLKG